MGAAMEPRASASCERRERAKREECLRERERGDREIGEVRETGGNPNSQYIYKLGRWIGYGLGWASRIFIEADNFWVSP